MCGRLKLLLLLVLFVQPITAKRKTINGVQYKTISTKTATALMTIQAQGDVHILESVKVGDRLYKVESIAEAYQSNGNVTAVYIPNSVKVIKSGAFSGFDKLRKLVLPLGEYVIENGAFSGCDIVEVEGNLVPYLEYKKGHGEDALNVKKPQTPTFSSYAEDKLKSRMSIWQTKKDYETMEQYKNRLTDENRKKRMAEFVNDLKKEYVVLYAPSGVVTTLGIYDSEYEIYSIHTMFYGNLFAKVPKNDAKNFGQNYQNVEVIPEFGVQSDTLAIMGCKFKLGENVYNAANSYSSSETGNDINLDLPPLNINLATTQDVKPFKPLNQNTVDTDIPTNSQDNKYTFALVIGNEVYEHEQSVPFANNDAKIFAEYCKKALGLPEENVKVRLNAGLNHMRHEVLALVNMLKAYDGEAKAFVYFAGHGAPDESSHMPYLLPSDGFASDTKSGYSLTEFYDELASAPSRMTLVFLDACFSGAKRDGKMLAEARGVAIKARSTIPNGNLVVFSASQGDETAYSDKKHGHGMFTYFLLKHLQDTKADTSIGELSDYVITNVKRTSVVENNGKIQTPSVVPSLNMMNSWKEIKLR